MHGPRQNQKSYMENGGPVRFMNGKEIPKKLDNVDIL
jgi:hypothetical protein